MTLDQNWTLRVLSVLRIFREIVYNADDEDVELDENHIAMIGDCMIERMGHNNQILYPGAPKNCPNAEIEIKIKVLKVKKFKYYGFDF